MMASRPSQPDRLNRSRRTGRQGRMNGPITRKASKIGSGWVVLACDEGQGGEIPLGPEGDLVRADRGVEA